MDIWLGVGHKMQTKRHRLAVGYGGGFQLQNDLSGSSSLVLLQEAKHLAASLTDRPLVIGFH